MEHQQINNSGANNAIDGIDVDKALTVLRKSAPWVVIIIMLTCLTAYLYIRWTKPLYESASELKLDVKSDASELGLTGLTENNNLNIISGEIELIKSKLFFTKVIETVDLSISYYTAGKVLSDEKFKTSPFLVDYNLRNQSLMDKRIAVKIIDDTHYTIDFTPSEEDIPLQYKFGERVNTSDIEFIVYLTSYYDPNGDQDFYFILNSEQAQINYLAQNITVEPLNLNANTIRISFKDHNPLKARDLVNAIDTIYLNYSREEKNQENKQKIEWLNGELKLIEEQLEGYENYFENFTIKNRSNDLDADLTQTILAINQLDSQRYLLSVKTRNVAQMLTDLDNNNFQIPANNPEAYPEYIVHNFQELADLARQRDILKLSYKETTFALTKLNREIDKLRSTLNRRLVRLKNKYESDLSTLMSRKNKLERSFVELPEKNTEFNKKQRFFKLYEEFYLSLMQSKAQFQLAEAGTTTDFKILSPATLPREQISPNVPVIYGIGLVAGLVLSFIFVSVSYLLHNKISTFAEIERLTSAPILGSIPNTMDWMDTTQLVIDKNPRSAVSEALRAIRTNIEFMMPEEQSKVISVTSTVGGEGKTFVAVNLGAIIALSKKRVLLLDLDMRKPRVHSAFQDNSRPMGVSTILINKHSAEECIQKTTIANLDYIPAGPTPPNPSELLLHDEFDSLLKSLKLEYDIIILDTPPVGLVTDGILAMKKVDLAIYIVRSHYSRKVFMNTLNRLMMVNHFKNIALIFNATATIGKGSYGYGYYEDNPPIRGNFLRRLINKRV